MGSSHLYAICSSFVNLKVDKDSVWFVCLSTYGYGATRGGEGVLRVP